jgi:hypothetical protein
MKFKRGNAATMKETHMTNIIDFSASKVAQQEDLVVSQFEFPPPWATSS